MAFQITAAVLLILFYGCYFFKMASQTKKGIQTDQIGKGKKGVVRIIELTMKAATIAVPVAEIINIYTNTSGLPVWCRWIGVAVALAGDMVFICSVLTMRDNWRAGVSKTDRTELVTNGIYQVSRNPAFLGFDLVYIGILLMFFHPALLAVSAFAALMLHLQIVNVEEDFLANAFGKEYLDYKKQVNRYLGRKKVF